MSGSPKNQKYIRRVTDKSLRSSIISMASTSSTSLRLVEQGFVFDSREPRLPDEGDDSVKDAALDQLVLVQQTGLDGAQ